MQKYSDFRPTEFDSRGLGCEDRQAWLVLPCSRTRDSGCLEESNFHAALEILGGESDTVEVHRFGHWGPGWFELILVDPESTQAKDAEEIESTVADGLPLDDEDLCLRVSREANLIWEECYRDADRIKYIRKHRYQFEFHSFSDMLACVRGKYFCGYASELIQ